MEHWPVVSKRSPIKVSLELRNTLLEFTMSCLLEQPPKILPFAQEYFSNMAEPFHDLEYDSGSETTSSEVTSEQLDLPDDLPPEYTRGGRSKVVYSEAYNPEKDTTDDEEDVVYEKTQEQKDKLYAVVTKCLLFRSLDRDQIMRVIDVMFPKEVQPDDLVIKQYDDGDNFYIIEYGEYDVFIADEPEAEPKHIFTYQNAGNFGELALMYNMPRAATIKARTEGRLWAMDRQTFRRIVLKAAFKKRKMYEELISKVPILQELTPYERMNLADALVPKVVQAGDIIMNEGDSADGMYFVEKGEVHCYIRNSKTSENLMVSVLEDGGYFGELALITHKPRAATVIAEVETKLAFLDKEAFERVLGPCLEIMERNIEQYKITMNRITSQIIPS